MCRKLIVLAAVAFARDAYADAKTQKMVTGYQREARSCKIQNDGVTKVLDGATAMQAEVNDDALAADITTLRSAQTPIQAFCTELAGMIDLLKADTTATYKSLEPQIMERDKKLRELRKAFKQATDGVTPVIRRLVPRINKRAATAGAAKPAESRPAESKPEAAPKPSVVTAPPPPPAPKMVDGPTTSLTVRAFTGGSCDEQAKQLATKTDVIERGPPKKRAPGTLAWMPGARWRASYVAGERLVQVECVATKAGGILLTLEGANPPASDRETLEVAARALAAAAK